MTPIMRENFGELTPGAVLDRIIMENVLRYTWSNDDRGKYWVKGEESAVPFGIHPSTELACAMRAVEEYVDMNSARKMTFELSITSKQHWRATLSLAPSGGDYRETYSHIGKDLAFQICRCLVEAYLHYGPKDYETFGWKPKRK